MSPSIGGGQPPGPRVIGFPRFPNLVSLSPSSLHKLTGILVGIGILCRVAQFLSNRSLWHDEVSMTLNLVGKSFAELLGPLAREQAAPPLWSMLQRATVLLFGASEYSLRFWPMIAGIVSLLLFHSLAWKALSPPAVPVAMLLFAVSDWLITHGAEVKPYSSDLVVAVALLAAAISRAPRRSALDSLGMATALAVPAIWLSFPAVFVYGAISLTVGWRMAAAPPQARKPWLAYLALNALVAASFMSLLLLSVSRQSSKYLTDYWAEGYPTAQPLWKLPLWLLEVHYNLWDYAYAPMGWLSLALSAFGVWAFWRGGRRSHLAFLLLPLGLTFAAACIKRYPYLGNRLMLFAVPCVLLFTSEGFIAVTRWLSPLRASLLAAVLLLPGLGLAGYHLVWPRSRHELRPLLGAVQQRLQPGDSLLVGAFDSFDYYWERVASANPQALRPIPPERHPGDRRALATPQPHQIIYLVLTPSSIRAEIDRLPGSSRVWIIYTAHARIQLRFDAIIEDVRTYADDSETLKTFGARAHLFRSREPPTGSSPTSQNSAGPPPPDVPERPHPRRGHRLGSGRAGAHLIQGE